MLNRNDLRSGLITKRTAPIIRSKEYINKIKQARLKISEASNRAKTDDEPKTPPKEDDKESKHDDADEDFLDVANDVNFEEDDDETLGKSSTAVKSDENHKAVKEDKEEKWNCDL
jgi:lipid II:glycine glycyltransferase (peptidoglycan interpeptide bridge formation enzyme)